MSAVPKFLPGPERPYYNAVQADNGLSIVEHGWIILDSRGKVWSGIFFPTEEGADSTMIRCSLLESGCTVKRARYVHWHTGETKRGYYRGSQRENILVDD